MNIPKNVNAYVEIIDGHVQHAYEVPRDVMATVYVSRDENATELTTLTSEEIADCKGFGVKQISRKAKGGKRTMSLVPNLDTIREGVDVDF